MGDVGTACNVMRTNGVRRENAFKNIGKNKVNLTLYYHNLIYFLFSFLILSSFQFGFFFFLNFLFSFFLFLGVFLD